MKENQSNFNPTFLPKASLALCFVSVPGQAFQKEICLLRNRLWNTLQQDF